MRLIAASALAATAADSLSEIRPFGTIMAPIITMTGTAALLG